MNNTVLEYLEGYFGNELNESTSDEDIMEAFYDLLETADAVEEFLEAHNRAERKSMYKLSDSYEPKKSIRNIPNAAELIRHFDMSGDGISVPAINNEKWGTAGFTKEEMQNEGFKRGDYVVGRRGNHEGQEYVVHTDHPSEPHMTVRIPKENGKYNMVRVSRSNFNKISRGYKSRRFTGPVPRSPENK